MDSNYFDDILTQFEEELFDELSEEVDSDSDFVDETKINYNDKNLTNNIKDVAYYENLKPTNPRISTMTICAGLNCSFINKEILLKYICQKCFDISVDNIKNHNCIPSKKKIKGGFYNQQTLLIKIKNGKKINLKIFWNGNVQLTGLKIEDEGKEAINRLIEIIKEINLHLKSNNLFKNYKIPFLLGNISDKKTSDSFLNDKNKNIVKCNINDIKLVNFKVCLINADFVINFEIKRNILYELLKKKYKIMVSYEPDYYQGVNSKFYWNKRWNSEFNYSGICRCSKGSGCNGKGEGNGDGDCKKVTIAIFQSGKIIITGSKNYCQTRDAYMFINEILDENYELIKKSKFLLKKTDDIINKKRYYLDINKIENYKLYKELINK